MRQSPLVSGLMYSMIYMLAGTLVTSLLLVFTTLEEGSWTGLTLGIHGLAMLAGGFIAGKRSESRGWYHGSLLGAVYSLVVWLIGFLAYDGGMTEHTLYVAITAVAAGLLGGIVGVNSKR